MFFLGFVDEFCQAARGLELAARDHLEHSRLHVKQVGALLGAARLDLDAGEGRAVLREWDDFDFAISSLTPGDARRESRGSRCRRRPRGRRTGGSVLRRVSGRRRQPPCFARFVVKGKEGNAVTWQIDSNSFFRSENNSNSGSWYPPVGLISGIVCFASLGSLLSSLVVGGLRSST